MYKVFFKESFFLLTDQIKDGKNPTPPYLYSGRENLRSYVFGLLSVDNIFHATLYHPDLKFLFSEFCTLFRFVEAAGGIVEKEEQILLIKRLGVYDLPKGHRETGESIETCAMREVEEECGVQQLHILHSLPASWHTYFRDNRWFLKKTYWFTMSCPPNPCLIPQTEEDIESVFWLPRTEIISVLPQTYASLRPVLQAVMF